MISFTPILALTALTLFPAADARIATPERRDDVQASGATTELKAKVMALIAKVFNPTSLDRRQDQCVQDDLTDLLDGYKEVVPFCQSFLKLAPVTQYVEVTPTTNVRFTYSTHTGTAYSYVRETPISTVTVTAATPYLEERDAQITPPTSLEKRHEAVMQRVRLAARATGSVDDQDLNVSVSSYCQNCQGDLASTTTQTITDAPATHTISVRANEVTTVVSTLPPAPVQVTTVTVEATDIPVAIQKQPIIASSASSSAAASVVVASVDANPTSQIISCPADDGNEETQLVGGKNFQYKINCGTDYLDDTLLAVVFATFTDCIGACSVANHNTNGPVCQGVSFSGPSDDGSANCFFKSSLNLPVPATDSDSAVLLGVGVYAAVSSSSAAFAESTADPAAVATIFTGGATTISIVAPTPAADQASYTSAAVVSSSAPSSVSDDGSWTSGYFNSSSGAWTSTGAAVVAATTTISPAAASSNAASSNGDAGLAGTGLISSATIPADDGIVLRNETTVVNGPGTFKNTTELVTIVYHNGTTLQYAYTTISGSRTASSGVSNVSASSSNTNIIIININNNGGSASTIGNASDDSSTTTIYSSTFIGPTSIYTSSSATSTATSTITSVYATTTTTSSSLSSSGTYSVSDGTRVGPPQTSSSSTPPFPYPSQNVTYANPITGTTTPISLSTGISSIPSISANSTTSSSHSSHHSHSHSGTGTSSFPINTSNSTMPYPTAPRTSSSSSSSSTFCATATVTVGAITQTVTQFVTVSAAASSSRGWSHHNRPYWGADQI